MEIKKPPKLIGLTGPYCAGKNHVALMLEQRGVPVLDLDKLGHKVIEAEKERLVARFGADILNACGDDTGSDDSGGVDSGGNSGSVRIDRKRLGKKVFGKAGELAALEDIIHPGVNRETLDWIAAQQEKACVINAALLHRSSAFKHLDAIIIVEACVFVRLLRARKRDRLPWAVLLKRFQSQRRFSSQYSLGKADIYIIENSGFYGFKSSPRQGKLENRLNEIFSQMGIK